MENSLCELGKNNKKLRNKLLLTQQELTKFSNAIYCPLINMKNGI